MNQIEIGVRLLNEAADTWVMLPAQEVMANICVILDHEVAVDPSWQLEFKPGDLVMVVDHKEPDGAEYPVAMHLYAGIIP